MYRLWRKPEVLSDLAPEDRPSFYDLANHAEAGVVTRGLTRYLTTHNYERSIRFYERMGMKYVRKIVMSTLGRMSTPGSGGNYRLNELSSDLEAAHNFAYGGSAFNEAVHTVALLPVALGLCDSVLDERLDGYSVAQTLMIGANVALVGLQRYNRARMIKRVDEELKCGKTFHRNYENWTGIDAGAVARYEQSIATTSPNEQAHTSSNPIVRHFTYDIS